MLIPFLLSRLAAVDDVEFLNVEDNKLAIATAVTEEEEDEFIPAAVEYDPDAKPPLYKNRRFRFYGCLAFFLMIVAVTAIVIPTQMAQDENLAPTAAPTTYRESLGIQEQIEEVRLSATRGLWMFRVPQSYNFLFYLQSILAQTSFMM